MRNYDSSVDIWSVGCIIAEILGRRPLFPGQDYLSQMQVICDIIGTPSSDELHHVQSPDAIRFVQQLGQKERKDFRKIFPNAHPELLDLLEKTLQFDPKRRITVDDALRHPYLAAVYEEDLVTPKVYTPELEMHRLPKETVRELIWKEITETYHPELLQLEMEMQDNTMT